jgi:predicted Zn-dependent protease
MHKRTLLSLLALVLAAAACTRTAYTNRRQLMLVPEAQEDQMGAQAWQQVVSKSKISTDPAANAMVTRIGQRIAQAAEKPDYKWEFKVIDDAKQVNAFCLPGGRVAVYTGILPITQDENGLAVVMSHEVAHALARHGAERMSDQLAAGVALNVALAGRSEVTQQLVLQAYGLGVDLPFNRKQESEADRIGLILMAKAGYDPRGAIPFWQRMSQKSGGGAPPEFLSTHPSDKTRIKDIEKHLPEALAHYKG